MQTYASFFPGRTFSIFFCVAFLIIVGCKHNTTPDLDTDKDLNKAPTITLSGASEITIEVFSQYVDPGVTANDDRDGELTSSILIDAEGLNTSKLGRYSITYRLSDSEGMNAIEVTRTVVVIDSQAPNLTLLGSGSLTLEVGIPSSDPGYVVNDNYDAVDSIAVDVTQWPDSLGVNTVTYTATDNSGNTTTVTRSVNYVNKPTVSLTTNDGDPEDFGTLDAGQTSVKTYLMKNEGELPLNIPETDGVIFTNFHTGNTFEFVGGIFPGAGGTCVGHLEPGQTCELVIQATTQSFPNFSWHNSTDRPGLVHASFEIRRCLSFGSRCRAASQILSFTFRRPGIVLPGEKYYDFLAGYSSGYSGSKPGFGSMEVEGTIYTQREVQYLDIVRHKDAAGNALDLGIKIENWAPENTTSNYIQTYFITRRAPTLDLGPDYPYLNKRLPLIFDINNANDEDPDLNHLRYSPETGMYILGRSFTAFPTSSNSKKIQLLRMAESDLALDSNFGDGGMVTLESDSLLGLPLMQLKNLLVMPDGRLLLLVIAGETVPAPGFGTTLDWSRWVVIRLLANGEIDPTFGTLGVVDNDSGLNGFYSSYSPMALGSDGRLVIGTSTGTSPPGIIRVIDNLGETVASRSIDFSPSRGSFRVMGDSVYLSGGTRVSNLMIWRAQKRDLATLNLEEDFGSEGEFTLAITIPPNSENPLYPGLHFGPDNKILLSANSYVARLTQEGILDNTFGLNGVVSLHSDSDLYLPWRYGTDPKIVSGRLDMPPIFFQENGSFRMLLGRTYWGYVQMLY